MRTSTVIKALLAATAVTPLLCHAESSVQTGGGALNTIARVDFQITIPKFIFLRVGTGTGAINAAGLFTTAPGANGAIDVITWAPTSVQVGTGALPGNGGDLAGGTVTAIVVANNGTVTMNATNGGALSDGAGGDSISYAKITTTASHNNTATTLPAPTLADGVGPNTLINPAPGKVVAQDAKWAYTYANDFVPPAGTYGGVNVNNGRVTYTASVP